jgi:uncharacterized membrane protein YdjX (TVP38/TMEM64 family)/rhodanese-related sulfurtransferase
MNMINKKLIRMLLLIALVIGIAFAIQYRDRFDAEALQVWVNDAGVLAPVVFIAIYALATVLFLPGSVITLAGGALFGPLMGTFYNLTGATLGAALAFIISRYLASDWIAHKAGGRVRQLINGVEVEGWRFVAFVRLVPLFPFNLLNYALGLTRIRFLHYLIATYVFMLPGAIAYTWIGYAGREAVSGGEGLIQKLLIALALLAVVAFLPRILGNIRRGPTIDIPELKNRIENTSTLVLDVRTAEEFVGEQGHISGAVNIAVEELEKRLGELNDYIERPIAIVCKTDKRSARASLILAQHGFHDVHVVRGGMTRWLEAGLPVNR